MRVYKAIYRDRDGIKKETQKWYLDFYDHLERRHKLAAFTTKRPTEDLGRNIETLISFRIAGQEIPSELQRWIEGLPESFIKPLTKWGLIDKKRVEAKKTLACHLQDWRASILASGKTAKHADQQYDRVRKIFDTCQFKYWVDISASKLQLEISKLKRTVKARHKNKKEKGLYDKVIGNASQKTKGYYLKACKQFCKWMVMDSRASQNPLLTLQIDPGQTAKRAALEPTELRQLLAYTETTGVSYGLTGLERAIVYQIAAETGLRASEIDALYIRDFDLKNGMVELSGEYTKNRQDAKIPLKRSMVQKLKAFFRGKKRDEKAFKMPYITNCARMIRKDIEKAQITIEKERGTVGFHSLRHSFGSMLAASGVHPKTAQQLMRHSDINLTLSRYTHVFRGQETEAINALPELDTSHENLRSKTA